MKKLVIVSTMILTTSLCFAGVKGIRTTKDKLIEIDFADKTITITRVDVAQHTSSISNNLLLEKKLQEIIDKKMENENNDVYIHVYSVNPFKFGICCVKKGVKPRPKWWVKSVVLPLR